MKARSQRGTMRARESARMGIARCETTVGVSFVVFRVDARAGGVDVRKWDAREGGGGGRVPARWMDFSSAAREGEETAARRARRTEPNRTEPTDETTRARRRFERGRYDFVRRWCEIQGANGGARDLR